MASSHNDTYPSYEDIEIEVPSSEQMVHEGRRLASSGDTEAAVNMWRKVLEIEPNNVTAIDLLNNAGAPLKDPRHAVLRKTESHQVVMGSIDADLPTIIVDTPPPSSLGGRKKLITAALVALVSVLGILLIALPSAGSKTSPEATSLGGQLSSDSETSTEAGGGESENSKQSFYRVSVTAEPERASISIDGRIIGQGSVSLRMPRDGKPHTLRVDAAGYESDEVSFVDVAPPQSIVLAPSPNATASSMSAPNQRRVRRGRQRGEERSNSKIANEAAPATNPTSTETPTETPTSSETPTTTETPTKPANPNSEKPGTQPKPSPVSPASDNKDPWAN